jgi:hypothetical protein
MMKKLCLSFLFLLKHEEKWRHQRDLLRTEEVPNHTRHPIGYFGWKGLRGFGPARKVNWDSPFYLNPYPRPSTASVLVKIVLPSKCDKGVSKGLSAELARDSTW